MKPIPTIKTIEELNELASRGALVGLVNVPIGLYHQGPGVSSTGIKAILKSPAHFKARLIDDDDSAAFRFGRAAHCRLLEPHLFDKQWHVRREKPREPERPEHLASITRKSNDGKAKIDAWEATWRAEYDAAVFAWEREADGKEALSPADAATIDAIVQSVAQNRLASKIFAAAGMAEVSVYWVDQATGVLCKARGDKIMNEAVFDLKTCASAAPKEFHKSIIAFNYHISAAFYLDGFRTVMPVKSFAWIAIEKKAPFGMGFYAGTEDLINSGRADYQRALEIYAECEKNDIWPGYAQEFVNVSLQGL